MKNSFFHIDSNDSIHHDGHKLFRVIYDSDVYYYLGDKNAGAGGVKLANKGDKGGYIESLQNLQEGGFISRGSRAYGDSCVKKGGALLYGSEISEHVVVENGSVLHGVVATGRGVVTNFFFWDREDLDLEDGEIRDGFEEERAHDALEMAFASRIK